MPEIQPVPQRLNRSDVLRRSGAGHTQQRRRTDAAQGRMHRMETFNPGIDAAHLEHEDAPAAFNVGQQLAPQQPQPRTAGREHLGLARRIGLALRHPAMQAQISRIDQLVVGRVAAPVEPGKIGIAQALETAAQAEHQPRRIGARPAQQADRLRIEGALHQPEFAIIP